MSFFDDGEETAPQPSTRATRPRAGIARGSSGARPRPPQPRRPQHAGGGPPDHQTVMMRRGVAAGVLVVLAILIVLGVNSCVRSEAHEELRTYNREVSRLGSASVEQVAKPLFAELASAPSKSALDVETQVDQLRAEAQSIASRAHSLSVPGEMEGAQRALLLAFDLREEAMGKLTGLLQTALGGKDEHSIAQIAGAMEIFLASDVIYSQRVVPLIQQTLAANGITGLATAPSRFLPNLGWLDTATVTQRLTGQSEQSSSSQSVTGSHGSALIGVSDQGNALAAEPTLNHLAGGSSPTFAVEVEDSGEFPQTNVKVDVTVSADGKQYKASRTIEKTEPGKTTTVEVPLSGVPTGVAAKVEAFVEPVPGETNIENNKGSYLAIFE